MKLELENLEQITNQVISSIEQGKNDIFEITEKARKEEETVKYQLASLSSEVSAVINEVDSTELKEKKARQRLMDVSRKFEEHSQENIQAAYETAHNLNIKLAGLRQKEQSLIEKRSELERRLVSIREMVKKAENLATHVSIAFDYLVNNLYSVSHQLANFQQAKNIGYKIIQAQEIERKRVAREIHDGPAQSLAKLTLAAELWEEEISTDSSKVRECLTDIKKESRSILTEIRRIIHQLRPMTIDDLGLVPTLRRFCEEFNENNNIQLEFICFGEGSKLDKNIEVTLYRIVQESVQNMLKHSQATRGVIKLQLSKKLTLNIRDNGKGFCPEEVLGDISAEKFGLLGMKERVNLAGGELNIKSSLGQGTLINVVIDKKQQGEEYHD
ncbi:sensor histidine kinase [Proteinivorax hydrogeniformans]|uniref:histidine kinase n=1 Tax=Proteinivorax hydrogeniformans TaxID=1826727 RepID=A0AAU8HUU9_9FIRM